MTAAIPTGHPQMYLNGLIENTEVDEDIKLMLDFDEIFNEAVSSVSSLDSVIPNTFFGGPATSALGTPIPLKPLATPVALHVPVSPSSSCSGLCDNLCTVAAAETKPTNLDKREFDVPTCVSPSPSTDDSLPASTAAKSTPKRSGNKKRRHSDTHESSEINEQAIEEQRRQRNRDHARKSRQRKKLLTGTLQKSLEELRAENAKLRKHICATIGCSRTAELMNARLVSPTQKFVDCLKKPKNQVLDFEAAAFLEDLRTGQFFA